MTNAHSVKSFTKTALFVALMSGSSLAVAQEVPIVTAAPEPAAQTEAPASAETKVAPPPITRTLPTQNDVVNPVALQQAEEETKAQAAAPAAVSRDRTTARASARAEQQAPAAPRRADPVVASPNFNEPNSAGAAPVAAAPVEALPTVDATEAVPAPATSAVNADNDLPLFGGIAAVLAVLGLGGLLVARRGAAVTAERPVAAAPRAAAPALAQTPVQTFATPQAPPPQPRVRETVNSRPDIPVTDPLFSRQVVAAPITDPMFAPRNDVQTPITDPLFAKHHDFAGRLRDSKPTPTPETV